MPIFEKNYALDLGTTTTLLFEQGKGLVGREPTVAVINRITGKTYKYGQDAKNIMNRSPADQVVCEPVSAGVISDYELTALFLVEMMKKVTSTTIVKPCVIACVPGCITGVEERAVIDACLEAGARKVYLLESAVATALGVGIDITKPDGNLIVDIGGGTTEVAIVASGGVVVSESIKIAGKSFDEAIIKFIRSKYNIQIGSITADELKRTIGGVIRRPTMTSTIVRGKDVTLNQPRDIEIDSADLIEAFVEPVNKIIDAVNSVLEKAPAAVVGDLKENGITLAGGCSQLYGIDRLIEHKTGIKTVVADDPITCTVYGAGKLLSKLDNMQEGMRNFARTRLIHS